MNIFQEPASESGSGVKCGPESDCSMCVSKRHLLLPAMTDGKKIILSEQNVYCCNIFDALQLRYTTLKYCVDDVEKLKKL